MVIKIPYERMSDEELQAITDGTALPEDIFMENYATPTELEDIISGAKYIEGTEEETPEEKFKVIDESHPDISWADRAKVKNFSINAQGAVDYLKKQYPKMQFKTSEYDDSKIYMKNPDEAEYRVLDSSDLELSDISDVAWDVPAAMASGLVAAKTGLATAASGFGAPVALPAAGVAGGLTGAGIETGRQWVGNQLGVADGYSPGQIGFAGAADALSPFLFGTGGKVGKEVLKKGLKGEAASKLAASQRGLIGKSWNATAPLRDVLGEGFTGIERDVFEYARVPGNIKKATDLARQSWKGLRSDATATVKDASRRIKAAKRNIGKQLERSVERSPVLVDIRQAKDTLKESINKVESFVANTPDADTPSNLAALKQARDTFSEFMSRSTGEEISDLVPAKVAQELKHTYANLSKVYNSKEFGATLSPSATQGAKRASAAMTETTAELDAAIRESLGDKYAELNDAYSTLKQHEEVLKFMNKKPLRNIGALNNASRIDERAVAAEVDETLGSKLMDHAADLKAAAQIGKPGIMPASRAGVTSTSRTGAAQSLGMALGYGAGSKLAKGEGAGYIFGLAGQAAGSLLGGGAATKLGLQTGDLIKRGYGASRDFSPWGLGLPSLPHTTHRSLLQQSSQGIQGERP